MKNMVDPLAVKELNLLLVYKQKFYIKQDVLISKNIVSANKQQRCSMCFTIYSHTMHQVIFIVYPFFKELNFFQLT